MAYRLYGESEPKQNKTKKGSEVSVITVYIQMA